MQAALRKGLYLPLLVALPFFLISCNSGYEWEGNWKLRHVEGENPEGSNYWNLSQDSLQWARKTSDGCQLVTYEVVTAEDKNLTVLGESSVVEGEKLEFKFEKSGKTMTATLVYAAGNEDDVGDEIILGEMKEIPFDLSTCSQP